MSPPAVLVVHNRYQERGGEESVFDAESALLESHGHRVERLVFDNRDLPPNPGTLATLRLGLQTVWSEPARRRLRSAVEAFQPDVVHFHNTLPLISPAAYSVCRRAGAAVVQTLHNYRLVCPSGMLYRDGAPCEDCVGRRLALPAVQHGCYRGSRKQTAGVAAMLAFHGARRTWQRDVDAYIAPSCFLRTRLVQGGLPEARIVVKPNFVEPDPGAKSGAGEYALFVGRLTREKGVETLLEAYRLLDGMPPLQVVGDGELAASVRAAAASDARITYRGRLDRDEVVETMGGASCLVLPSVWYENFPVTIVEAFARGLPVVASRIGAIAGIVEEDRTGRLFRSGDAVDLGDKLSTLAGDAGALSRLGASARDEYVSKYTGARNYAALIGVYDRALAHRGATPGRRAREAVSVG